MQTLSILAQTTFFDSTIGSLVKTLLAFFGTGFVLFQFIGAFRAMAGRGGASEAAKKIIVALIVGAFCFRPEIIESIMNLFSGIADSIFGSGGDVEDIISGVDGLDNVSVD